MPFTKRLLYPNISLIVSAGLLLTAIPVESHGQLIQYSCRANAAGDGWICESTLSSAPELAIPQATFPEPEPVSPPASISEPEPDPEPEPAIPQVSITEPEPTLPQTTLTEPEPVSPQASISEAAPESSPEPSPSMPANADNMDWLPREQMTAQQLQDLADNCCGAFIDPVGPVADLSADPADAKTLISANQGFEQISQTMMIIDGDVTVQQGYRSIQNNSPSGSTSIDNEQNTILMQGDIVFREPGILLRGSSAFIDSDDETNRIETAEYVLHDYGIHGQADSLVYSSEQGTVTIENGEFSRCEPENNFWLLRADKIVLNQEQGRAYATAVSLMVRNVPLFYYPGTLAFPLGDERISGFLAASTGSTRSGGFDFELPYYLNLAPNYDATVAARLISDRGVLASTEFRYLGKRSMNTLNMAHLAGDKLFDPNTANIVGSESPTAENRWFIGYEHRGAWGRNWRSFVDYSAISDEDYFYDLSSNGLNVSSRTHLNRQARLTFSSDYLRGGLNVQRLEIIDPFYAVSNINKPFDRLPQLYFDTDRYLPGGFQVSLKGEVTSFDRSLDESLLTPTHLANGALVNGERINLEPAISWSLEAPGWFVRSTAKYKHIAYKLQNQAIGTEEDPELGIGVYSADSGLIFERQMSRGNGGYTQTLEPRLFYLYSEFEDQSQLPLFDTSEFNFGFYQLFREDRYSGGDRVGDADQLTFALTSRILDPAGKERARISIGQIEYFEDRLVSLNNPLQARRARYSPLTSRSALTGELAFSLGQSWQVNTDLQWNQDTEEIDEGSLQLRYHRDESHIFNLSYRFRNQATGANFLLPSGIDPRIKQTDASVIWPINENWKVLARWNYDHSNSRNLETFAGIEYSNCCAIIRLIGREWVDQNELFVPNIEPDRGIFVQFTLKGLGNITGGGISNLLSDGILGFRETNYD